MIAGCVGQDGGVLQSIMNVQVAGGGAEDVTITAKIPEFARSGGIFSWQLVVQPSIDIKDFRFEIYDHGLFTTVTGENIVGTSDINANSTKTFPITYTMGDAGLAESTNIKMRSFYSSNATMSTTVAVLNEVEYFQRKANGKLDEIPVSTYSSTNPLQLTVTWSDTMPLLDAQGVQMYVNYQNKGEGFIDRLYAGNVTFTIPSNLEFVTCDDYGYNAATGKMTLMRDLDFLQKTAKKSTCTFKAKASGAMDSRSLVGTALYMYELDSTVNVPIIQK